ncbi:hypothetical protein AAG570_005173 [Ranatra chinensis]|uniref:Laminin IV type A domain-containing protein n=1 Tax=Ranatra chinensis TaxID=642074 RepID=A0ABD0XZR1_9HEMI
MGVTEDCYSSNWYRDQVKSVFTRDNQDYKLIAADDPSTELPVSFDPLNRQISYSAFEPKVYYWLLPARFLGDKVTSYGGNLVYSFRFVPTPGGQSSKNTAADVVIKSLNGIQLSHFSTAYIEPDRQMTITVPLTEEHWQREDGAFTDREHLLMALADLSDIMIKATYTTSTRQASLMSVTLETATDRNTGLNRAAEVEQCRCPEGYRGLSCEDCDAGYTRADYGLYLGICEPCNCNGHSSDCHPDTGVCFVSKGTVCFVMKSVYWKSSIAFSSQLSSN